MSLSTGISSVTKDDVDIGGVGRSTVFVAMNESSTTGLRWRMSPVGERVLVDIYVLGNVDENQTVVLSRCANETAQRTRSIGSDIFTIHKVTGEPFVKEPADYFSKGSYSQGADPFASQQHEFISERYVPLTGTPIDTTYGWLLESDITMESDRGIIGHVDNLNECSLFIVVKEP